MDTQWRKIRVGLKFQNPPKLVVSKIRSHILCLFAFCLLVFTLFCVLMFQVETQVTKLGGLVKSCRLQVLERLMKSGTNKLIKWTHVFVDCHVLYMFYILYVLVELGEEWHREFVCRQRKQYRVHMCVSFFFEKITICCFSVFWSLVRNSDGEKVLYVILWKLNVVNLLN
jgi:hypothetical protein